MQQFRCARQDYVMHWTHETGFLLFLEKLETWRSLGFKNYERRVDGKCKKPGKKFENLWGLEKCVVRQHI